MNQPEFKILIVCTGNTCRSPMAEGILKALLRERGREDIRVSSAGTGAIDGMSATPFAIEAAKVWGVDISQHKARHLERAMLTEADLILAMSAEHVDMMQNKTREAANKMFLIKAFPAPFSHSQEGVNDPIGGAIDDYNQTYLELDEILRRIEGRIIQFGDSLKRNS